MVRLLLIAEIGGAACAGEAQCKLDAFRETVQPALEYGITLYRPDWSMGREPAIWLNPGEEEGASDDGLLRLIRDYEGSGDPALIVSEAVNAEEGRFKR